MAVTPATIAVALGRTAPSDGSLEFEQWSLWISDALMLINARKVQLGVETDLDADVVDYVVREAVVAQVLRPDDATQVAVSVDDGSVSRTYRSSRGRVTILDEWWTMLGLGGTRQAFDIDTATVRTTHLPWCSLAFGATYCSCGADIAGFPIFELADD